MVDAMWESLEMVAGAVALGGLLGALWVGWVALRARSRRDPWNEPWE